MENMQELLQALRYRLADFKCELYTDEELLMYLKLSFAYISSVSNLNKENLIDVYSYLIVKGAVVEALASHALIEKGREYNVNDCGLFLSPPKVSDTLMTQWEVELRDYNDKLRLVLG